MHNTLTASAITSEDLDFADLHIAPGRRIGKAMIPMHEVLAEEFELTEDHLAELQAHVDGVVTLPSEVHLRPLQRLHRQHHRLAQYLSMGMSHARAGILCDYHPTRISILTGDPAFQALLAHYASGVEEAHRSFVQEAADLNEDMVLHLRDILETSPEKITPQVALEAIKTLADRTGNGPVAKNMNVNLNANIGDRMAEIRARRAALGS